jgi:hypothetical protein
MIYMETGNRRWMWPKRWHGVLFWASVAWLVLGSAFFQLRVWADAANLGLAEWLVLAFALMALYPIIVLDRIGREHGRKRAGGDTIDWEPASGGLRWSRRWQTSLWWSCVIAFSASATWLVFGVLPGGEPDAGAFALLIVLALLGIALLVLHRLRLAQQRGASSSHDSDLGSGDGPQ